jgi:hypothetical protein
VTRPICITFSDFHFRLSAFLFWKSTPSDRMEARDVLRMFFSSSKADQEAKEVPCDPLPP